MNVYDFDKTIFWGDTEDRFFAYIFEKRPDLWFYKWNHHIWEKVFNWKFIENKTLIREIQYSVLRKIDDVDAMLEAYWEENACHMMKWYDSVKRPDDVIATGTPAFIMEPIMRRLGLTEMVATDMDKKTGKINGIFAVYGYKVDEFKKKYSLDDIDEFYSDAWSDHYLAEYAKKAYVVHDNEQITEWNEYFTTHPKK